MSKYEKKQPWSLKKKILAALCVVLSIILLMLIAITVFVGDKFDKLNRVPGSGETYAQTDVEDETDAPDPDFTGPTLDPGDVNWGGEPTATVGGDEIINILLVGQDARAGQGRQRSDSMILCTFNTGANTLTMTSFLRDTYVQIPGYSDNRLNVPYVLGGFSLLNETLELNFGVHVDANIEVNFSGFASIIDAMGGVSIELTSAEAQYLNRRGNWDVPGVYNWSLTKGVNLLTGEQALAYSRIRYLDSDFGRSNRQRKVLTALLEKCKGMNLLELNNLVDTLLPYVTTDMTNEQIVSYVRELLPMLASVQLHTQYIPADNAYTLTMIRGMSVLLPDLEKNRQILFNTLMN